MANIAWLSWNPTQNKADWYPSFIANIIEEAYQNNKDKIELGSNFYNATIHFNEDNIYQSTPAIWFGPRCSKIAGYRSVKRVTFDNILSCNVDIISVNGEKRIYNSTTLHDRLYNYSSNRQEKVIEIPYNAVVNNTTTTNIVWNNSDTTEINDDNEYILWLWCKGNPTSYTSIFKLGDNWWVPYSPENNEIIETGYNNNQNEVNINILNNEERIIQFKENSCFGTQKDTTLTKVRYIKRVIVNGKDLKNILNLHNTNGINYEIINAILDNVEIPYEFKCPISYSLMLNPVFTSDGQVYDEHCIYEWFHTYNNTTSPLTNVQLDNLDLTPALELKVRIGEFIRENTPAN